MSNTNNTLANEIVESVEADMIRALVAKNEADLAKHNTRENTMTMEQAMNVSETETTNNTNEEKKVNVNTMNKQQLKDHALKLTEELAMLKVAKNEMELVQATLVEDNKRQAELIEGQNKTIVELQNKLAAFNSEEQAKNEKRAAAKASMIKALKIRPVSELWGALITNVNDNGTIYRVSFPIDFYQNNGGCKEFLGNLAKHAKNQGHLAVHQPDHLMITIVEKKVETKTA